MWEERFRQELRLRLLALVLTLALTWYALNPAPGPLYRVGRSEEHPDEKRREEKSPLRAGHEFGGKAGFMMEPAAESLVEDIEDLEWPELIDVS